MKKKKQKLQYTHTHKQIKFQRYEKHSCMTHNIQQIKIQHVKISHHVNINF